MSAYVDQYGLYNVKPCPDGISTGNDGWILTSYSQKLGLPVDQEKLLACFTLLKKRHDGIPLERLPGKDTPMLSRDVILGLFWLNLITIDQLIEAKWNFSPFPLERFNLFKTIKQFWTLRNLHRNHFWTNRGFEQVYRFAFSVPVHDRAHMLRVSGRHVPLIYRIYEWASHKLSAKSNSSKLIAWRKGIELIDAKVMEDYFGKDHDFCKRIRGEI